MTMSTNSMKLTMKSIIVTFVVFAKFPCNKFHSLSHTACIILWVKHFPTCPVCNQVAKCYIDSDGNEHDISKFCGKIPLTPEQEEARQEVIRKKREKNERQGRKDDHYFATRFHDEQAEKNKAEQVHHS